jgi:hypothetical protein
MPIDFPTGPTEGQIYSYQGRSWIYNGSAWDGVTPNYTLPPPSGNAIINGAFEINQRGFTTGTTSGQFVADRFSTFAGGSSGFTASLVANASEAGLPEEIPNIVTFAGTITNATNGLITLFQRIENVSTFAGQTVTLSFYAKGSTAGTIGVRLNQNFGTGGSAQVVQTQTQEITTSFVRYQMTFNLDSIAGKTIGANNQLFLGIDKNAGTLIVGGGYNPNYTGTLSITGVQLEAGAVATPFKRNAPSIQAELAACQRYYERGASQMFVGFFTNNAVRNGNTHYRVVKRVTPTVTFNFAGFAGDLGVNSPENSSYYVYNATNSSEPYVSWTASAEL